jgi:DNA-directed RNA polymerase specialized sigma subunit
VLDDAGRALAERYINVASGAAWKYWRRAPRADVDELRAVANAALCQALERFPDYQREHGYALDDHRYLVAFIDRRVQGALLDWGRAQDWLTRSQRAKAKLLQDAELQGAASIAEAAEAAGLTEAEAHEVLAAKASAPVHLEGERRQVTGLGPDTSWVDSIPDPDPTPESAVEVAGIMSAALGAIRGMSWPQQAILAWHYLRDGSLRDYAKAVGISEHEAAALHQSAILAVHEAMLGEAVEEAACPCGRNGSCRCCA